MAFYPFATGGGSFPMGHVLRTALDEYRSALAGFAHVKGVLQQMTDEQVQAAFGFVDVESAQGAKSELLSDIPSASAAEQQMLDQFG